MSEHATSEVSVILHATAIAFDADAVLFRGPPGSGKSDLALRCVTAGALPKGCAPGLSTTKAELVADDRCRIDRSGDAILLASSPPTIAGLLEVRGVGIVQFPFRTRSQVRLMLDLVDDPAEIERLPPDRLETDYLLGVPIRRWWMYSREASAPIKVAMLLSCALRAHC